MRTAGGGRARGADDAQFHCNAAGTDRIEHVKEVAICSYTMLVSTPRLCNDATFLPPSLIKPNLIVCRKVLSEAEIAQQKEDERAEAERLAAELQMLQIEQTLFQQPADGAQKTSADLEADAQEKATKLLAIEQQVNELFNQEL